LLEAARWIVEEWALVRRGCHVGSLVSEERKALIAGEVNLLPLGLLVVSWGLRFGQLVGVIPILKALLLALDGHPRVEDALVELRLVQVHHLLVLLVDEALVLVLLQQQLILEEVPVLFKKLGVFYVAGHIELEVISARVRQKHLP